MTAPDALGPGKLLSIVTFLEMREPPRRVPAAPPRDDLSVIEAAAPSVAFYRFLYNTVGAPWRWAERRRWTDQQLAAEIGHPLLEIHVLYAAGTPVGYCELDFRHPGDVELRYFGVVPQRIGQGLGSYLIDWAIHRVWSRGSHRFWLHTCTRDHPKALAFYQRAGFVPYAVQQEVLNDPFLDGTIAPDEIAPPG